MVEYCSLFSFQRQKWLILMLFQIDDDQLFCNDSDCPHISLPSAIFDSNNLWPCSGKESQRQMSTITSRQSIGLKIFKFLQLKHICQQQLCSVFCLCLWPRWGEVSVRSRLSILLLKVFEIPLVPLFETFNIWPFKNNLIMCLFSWCSFTYSN